MFAATDDDAALVSTLSWILKEHGYEVTTVLSGAQALDLLEREAFDLVFTDLKMAEMGGMELLETLRADEGIVFRGLFPANVSSVEYFRRLPRVLMALRREILFIGLNVLEGAG